MAVEAEALPHERVEVAGEEVGEEERPRLLVVQRGEAGATGEDLVAVGAGEAPDLRVAIEDGIEVAARPTVGVGDEHRPRAAGGVEHGLDRRGDALGAVVEVRREVAHLDVRAGEHGAQLGGERPARHDQRPVGAHATDGPGGSARASRRALTSRWAVSAATAASRQ